MKETVAAVQADGLYLPLIDFSPFLSGDRASKLATAAAITHGFKTAGFIYLHSFGIAPAVIRAVFAQSAAVFALPQAQKDAIANPGPESNRGYGAVGREKLIQVVEGRDVAEKARAQAPDLKETFQFGREDSGSNLWPEDGQFRDVMLDFFERGQRLNVQVMSAIALGLGLDEGFFDKFTDKADNSMRLLHYPAVPKSVFTSNETQVRAGAHSDYGSITLLFQDNSGGLQVKSATGAFIDATPIPDTVVINAGDLLARWSNNAIKSTLHRVVEPPMKEEVEEYPPRYSIAYFCQPNYDAVIESIPGTAVDGKAKYPPIGSLEHLLERLKATY